MLAASRILPYRCRISPDVEPVYGQRPDKVALRAAIRLKTGSLRISNVESEEKSADFGHNVCRNSHVGPAELIPDP